MRELTLGWNISRGRTFSVCDWRVVILEVLRRDRKVDLGGVGD